MRKVQQTLSSSHWTRRSFLAGLTAASATLVGTAGGTARANTAPAATRKLAFHSLHTGEELQATYLKNGRLVPEAFGKINEILRDWRTEEVYEMDRGLLDFLSALRARIGSDAPFNVISAYRSPKTNAKLAAKSNGVAKRSLHMRGMAIDISLPGCPLGRLHKEALALRAGGVGRYSGSGFIHIDTGRVRKWGS